MPRSSPHARKSRRRRSARRHVTSEIHIFRCKVADQAPIRRKSEQSDAYALHIRDGGVGYRMPAPSNVPAKPVAKGSPLSRARKGDLRGLLRQGGVGKALLQNLSREQRSSSSDAPSIYPAICRFTPHIPKSETSFWNTVTMPQASAFVKRPRKFFQVISPSLFFAEFCGKLCLLILMLWRESTACL